jgi:hypothetical protein
MNSMRNALLISIVLISAAAAGLYLPFARKKVWLNTIESTADGEGLSPEQEVEVQKEMVVDESIYKVDRDTRIVSKIPSSPIELEAVFRQRKNDTCETLETGEPLELKQFALALTQRDKFQSPSKEVMPSTRVPVLTIGLNMQPADQRSLPTLSRSTILNYLESNFVSIQARVSKDPVTRELTLQYRPIGAVGGFTGLPVTKEYVEAINSTIKNVRGIGMYEPKSRNDKKERSPFQIAILLFRSTYMDDSGVGETAQHELGFVCMGNSNGDEPDISFIATTNQRKTWLLFSRESSQMPKRLNDCSMVATVRFDQFITGGLQPKTGIVRRISNRAKQKFDVEDIERFLASENLTGGWTENLDLAVEAILDGRVSQQKTANK